ncbi:hypothetical protein BD413DRAFT_136498 [Trametes elegans]|nr:hypothetical protein BD413DRAFT_136498 [Trametes elegans]
MPYLRTGLFRRNAHPPPTIACLPTLYPYLALVDCPHTGAAACSHIVTHLTFRSQHQQHCRPRTNPLRPRRVPSFTDPRSYRIAVYHHRHPSICPRDFLFRVHILPSRFPDLDEAPSTQQISSRYPACARTLTNSLRTCTYIPPTQPLPPRTHARMPPQPL